MKGLIIIEAIIFCDEKRSELLPLTEETPFPLIKICDKPLGKWVIEEIGKVTGNITAVSSCGFGEMRAEFKNIIRCHNQKNRFACDEDVIILNGNILTDMNFADMIKFHYDNNSEVTVAKRINNYAPFPIYIISRKIFSKYLSKNDGILNYNKIVSFISEYRECLYKSSAYFLEIKSISDYLKACSDVLNGCIRLNEKSDLLKSKGVILGNNSLIEVGAVITPPVYIGDNAIVEAGARLGPYAVVGARSLVKSGSETKYSIIGKGCYVDKGAEITGSVLDNRVKIKQNAKLLKGCTIGKNAVVGENSVISYGIKIFADKNVKDGSEILSHIIYDSGTDNAGLFKGETRLNAGTEFTPELLLKLGSAFAVMENSGKIAIGVDSSPMASMAKYSLVSGIMSLGGTVYDLGENLISVFRSALLFYKAAGGIYISCSGDFVKISLFGSNGAYLDTKLLDCINNLIGNPEYTTLGAKYLNPPISLENYRNHYYKDVLRNFRNSRVNRFLYYNSSSAAVKEYIETVSNDLHIKSVELKEKALRPGVVSAVIPRNGEGISIYTEEGELLSEDVVFMIKLLILIGNHIYKPVVVPGNVSSKVVKFANINNIEVVVSGSGRAEFLNAVLENGSREQYMLFFDEIYGLMKILEFISTNDTELSVVAENLPDIFKATRNVVPHTLDTAKIFENLLKEDRMTVEKNENSIKISKDAESWVLIRAEFEPYNMSVVAEGFSEEYARELCDFYADKIEKIK